MNSDDNRVVETDIDGLIKRIEVKNFLCHDNLAIDFTSGNIHWVTGLNGSGKSAIIAALVVGLGGKAMATHRGKNIQSLIKNGRDFAVTEITIKNDTNNAYKHDIYGNEIKVIRRITTSGSSQYTVKTASGEKVSNSFSEVTNIMLAHQIQVDNPISILDQEEAKTFSTIKPDKMYSLFRRATNLDQSRNNYTQVLDNCKKAKDIKLDKEKTCASLKKEHDKWKNKQEQLISLEKKEHELESIDNEMFWSEVEELKNEMKNLENKIVMKKRDVTQSKSMCEDSENIQTAIQTLKQKQKEFDQTIISLNQEQRKLQDNIRKERGQCDIAQSKINNVRYRQEKAKENIKNFKDVIQDIDSGGRASRREAAELEERHASGAAERASDELAAAERALDDAVRRQAEADAAVAAETDDARDLRRRLEEARARRVRAQNADPLALWGEDVAELCRRVQQATLQGQFDKPPIGPIGHYLRLNDQRWAGALEHIIGNHKKTFCVHSAADSRRLIAIMNEVFGERPKPTVSCSAFLPPHDTARHRVRARPSALDALRVNEPVVANFLVDNLALETVLLAADDETAMGLASKIENVPTNCSKIVTETCAEFYPVPNYRSYGSDPRRRREHFLQLDNEDAERRLREEVASAAAALQAKERLVEQTQLAAESARRELRAAQARCKRGREQLRDCSAALDAARRKLDDGPRAPQHDALEEELNKTKEEYQNLNKEIEQFNEILNKHKLNVRSYENQIKDLENKIKEKEKEKQNLQIEINKKQVENDESSNWKLELEQNKGALKELEQEMLQKREEISTKYSEASGPPFERPRPRAELRQCARQLRSQLSALRGLALDAALVARELERARRSHRDLRQLLDTLNELIAEIEEAVDERLRYCHELEHHITRKVKLSFVANLSTHDYYGSLQVSHSSGTLEMCATGRDGARDVRDAKALSGGERSYCTVALLLALWECVELPFYFLDEFDVCLDKTNRRFVVNLLIDFARRHPARQLVMVSPTDPHDMREPPILHRLENPRP